MKPAPKPAQPQPPVLSPPPAWTPSWRWHAKVLAGISLFLLVAYFALDALLSQLPPPYALRDIPPEMTPWLKK